jgi:hypothetical protein
VYLLVKKLFLDVFDFGSEDDFDSIVPSSQASSVGHEKFRGISFSSIESSFSGDLCFIFDSFFCVLLLINFSVCVIFYVL